MRRHRHRLRRLRPPLRRTPACQARPFPPAHRSQRQRPWRLSLPAPLQRRPPRPCATVTTSMRNNMPQARTRRSRASTACPAPNAGRARQASSSQRLRCSARKLPAARYRQWLRTACHRHRRRNRAPVRPYPNTSNAQGTDTQVPASPRRPSVHACRTDQISGI